jgi:hypothetical protein
MQAARASGAAISKTTIKKITLVLNRRTQHRERAILFSAFASRSAHVRRKMHNFRHQRKTALPGGNAASMRYQAFLKPESCGRHDAPEPCSLV